MPWMERCVMDLRMRFVVEYDLDELSMAELCRKYNISRKTGYKWLARVDDEGPEGLKDRSRAPRHHPNQIPESIEQAVVDLRCKHPTWGPKKLLKRLQSDKPHKAWPSRSTIAAILSRRGLAIRRKRRRRVAPREQPFAECDGPNRVWCADFKGWFRTGDGCRCDPLTITDAYSRYIIRCQIMPDGTYRSCRPLFEAAFREYGLPGAIRTDNGPPFASRAIAGLSRLSIWWIQLGIDPERIDPGKPQQNGRHERMHLTLKKDTADPPAANERLQQRRFGVFIKEFNYERPHEALGLDVPASHFERSTKRYPSRIEQVRYPSDWQVRRVGTKGKFKWKGRDLFLSEVLYRQEVGFEPLHNSHWRVYFGPKALGIFDEGTGRLLTGRQIRQRGLIVTPDAGKPPSATLQEASLRQQEVLPMCSD